MASDLSELFERAALCRAKISDHVSMSRDQADKSVHWWVKSDGPAGRGAVQAKLLEHPTLQLRQDVGMVVNELRSILDALACKLAIRNGQNDTRQTYFPITGSKDAFFKPSEGQKKIAALSLADREKIEAFKPWLPPDEDHEDGNMVLYLLHQADIYRKHNDLLVWACRGGVSPAGTGYVQSMITDPVTFRIVGKTETLAYFQGVTTDFSVIIELIYDSVAHLSNIPAMALMTECQQMVEDILRKFN